MTIDYKIRDEKLQSNFNREATNNFYKLINMNMLQVKNYYLLIKDKLQNKLVYIFSFRKNFENQTEKQVDALQSLNLSNKTNELEQIAVKIQLFYIIKY